MQRLCSLAQARFVIAVLLLEVLRAQEQAFAPQTLDGCSCGLLLDIHALERKLRRISLRRLKQRENSTVLEQAQSGGKKRS
jgi:hypothetical protein